jgi:hypothetical protein
MGGYKTLSYTVYDYANIVHTDLYYVCVLYTVHIPSYTACACACLCLYMSAYIYIYTYW